MTFAHILNPEAQVSEVISVAIVILQFSGTSLQDWHQLCLVAACLESGLCPFDVPAQSIWSSRNILSKQCRKKHVEDFKL